MWLNLRILVSLHVGVFWSKGTYFTVISPGRLERRWMIAREPLGHSVSRLSGFLLKRNLHINQFFFCIHLCHHFLIVHSSAAPFKILYSRLSHFLLPYISLGLLRVWLFNTTLCLFCFLAVISLAHCTRKYNFFSSFVTSLPLLPTCLLWTF